MYYMVEVNIFDRKFGCGLLNKPPLVANIPHNISDNPIWSDFKYMGFARGVGVFRPDSRDKFSLYVARINLK